MRVKGEVSGEDRFVQKRWVCVVSSAVIVLVCAVCARWKGFVGRLNGKRCQTGHFVGEVGRLRVLVALGDRQTAPQDPPKERLTCSSSMLPFAEGCAGANEKASPPGRRQEQASEQRCTFGHAAFSSVQFMLCDH